MKINNISTKDITFVVQGNVDKYTRECLRSIRIHFPGSFIILSTWKNISIKNLDFDQVILNEDPGACVYAKDGAMNNINRQLLSTRKGLEEVKTKYVAKVRSDLKFTNSKFLNYFNLFDQFVEEYKIVKKRMISLSMYSRNLYISLENGKIEELPFYFSDWFLFGETEDVVEFFSTPLIENIKEFSGYFLENTENEKMIYPTLWAKMTPENYFCSEYFSRFLGKNLMDDQNNYIEGAALISEKLIVNNVVILNFEYSGIFSQKWEGFSKDEWSLPVQDVLSLIFFPEYLKLYQKHCDTKYILPKESYQTVRQRKLTLLKQTLFDQPVKKLFSNIVLTKISKCYNFMKGACSLFLPSYRVSRKSREDLLLHERTEQERFHYLIYRLEKLEKKLEKKNQHENKKK